MILEGSKYYYYLYFKYCYYFCFSPGYKVILLRSMVCGRTISRGAPTITIFSNHCPRSGTVFFYKVVTVGKHILLILSTIHYWLEACVVIASQVTQPTC